MFDRLRSQLRLRVRRLLEGRAATRNHCVLVGVRFVCWNQIPGDYLEFGCGTGRTFVESYRVFQKTRATVAEELSSEDRACHEISKPKFFAFDSFEGLPDASGIDKHPYSPRHWRKSKYAFSVDGFERTLSQHGVPVTDVRIISGWFSQTLTQATKTSRGLTQAAMVYIDCDYYKSTVPVLDFITDLVQDGTVIVFDDFNFFRGSPELGERRAFTEWLERNSHIQAIQLAQHDFSTIAFYLRVKC